MKKIILAMAVLMLALALLLPFVSTDPDALENLTENSANEQPAAWNGIMADYSVALDNPYISTLTAGLLGTAMVFVATYALGKKAAKKQATGNF